jgi:hypothetical protein
MRIDPAELKMHAVGRTTQLAQPFAAALQGIGAQNEPHRHEAGAHRFELCATALETACSPRSTLLYRVSGGNRTRRHDLHRVAC